MQVANPVLQTSSIHLLACWKEDGGGWYSIVAQHPAAVQDALKQYWAPVYADRPGDGAKASKFLDLYSRRNSDLFEFASLEPPFENGLWKMSMEAKHSACGVDGVPGAAYRADSFLSAKVLHNSFSDLPSSCPLKDTISLNEQLFRFAPKGASDADRVAVFRTPCNPRIIFGSNCDSKLIAETIAHKLVPPTVKVAPANQRGFCKGRQLSPNRMDLDISVRLFNSKIGISKISLDKVWKVPVSVLYDLCNSLLQCCMLSFSMCLLLCVFQSFSGMQS